MVFMSESCCRISCWEHATTLKIRVRTRLIVPRSGAVQTSEVILNFSYSERLLLADSVEKVGLAATRRSEVPVIEVTASHFKLSFGVLLSVLAQV